ncbi:hypothetical protein LCGC14_1140330 [marine sediment metagenome]|uniref:Uncharacterized protein n=1 Tax=marine sediment metagenome TaxID=412755 RepID=A0A0F9M390_9ZZZZ
MKLEICSCGKDSVIIVNFRGLCSDCFLKKTDCDTPAFYHRWLKSQGKINDYQTRGEIYKTKVEKINNGKL